MAEPGPLPRWTFGVGALALACLVLVPGADAAVAPKGPTQAAEVVAAMDPPPGMVQDSWWVAYPGSTNAAAGVSDAVITPVFGIPSGDTFAVLSTGLATDAPGPQGFFASTSHGSSYRGALDVVVLAIEFQSGNNNRLGFDYQFLSEEYPQFVGDQYNDAFIAELDAHTWTVGGGAISAPDSFAYHPGTCDIASVNEAIMNAGDAFGSVYGGATEKLRAVTEVQPFGTHTLYLSIFDVGDFVYDSAVFIDNLHLFNSPNPLPCTPSVPDFDWLPSGVVCTGHEILFRDNSVLSEGVSSATTTWSGAFDLSGPWPLDAFHIFTEPGIHEVTLALTDARGTNESTQEVDVVDCFPSAAAFTYAPDPPCLFHVITFTDESDYDPRAQWALSVWSGAFSLEDDQRRGHQHTFTSVGVHEVVLTVLDSTGAEEVATATLTVRDCRPRAPPPPPSGAATPEPVQGLRLLDATSSSAHIAWDTAWGAHSYQVHCGEEDGFAPSQDTLVGTVQSRQFEHEGLSPDQTCHYSVVSVGETGSLGPPSGTLLVTTLVQAGPAAEVQDLRITVRPEGVEFSWRTDVPAHSTFTAGPAGRPATHTSHAEGDLFVVDLEGLAPGTYDYEVHASATQVGPGSVLSGRFLVHAGERSVKTHAPPISHALGALGSSVHSPSFFLVHDEVGQTPTGIEEAHGAVVLLHAFPEQGWFLLHGGGSFYLVDAAAGRVDEATAVPGVVEGDGPRAGSVRVGVVQQGPMQWVAIEDPRPGQALLGIERSDGAAVAPYWREGGMVMFLDAAHASYLVQYEGGSGTVAPVQSMPQAPPPQGPGVAVGVVAAVALVLLAGAAAVTLLLVRRRG